MPTETSDILACVAVVGVGDVGMPPDGFISPILFDGCPCPEGQVGCSPV